MMRLNPRRHGAARREGRRRLRSAAVMLGLLGAALTTVMPSAPVEAGAFVPPVSPLEKIATGRIDAGADGTCVVRPAGWAQCWGKDTSGLNGNGPLWGDVSDPSFGATVESPSPLAFRSITRGGGHTCGIADSVAAPAAKGVIFCWGFNGDGQSLGTVSEYQSATSSALPAIGTVWTDVAAGDAHTCALDSSGDVYCWGQNGFGQLGQGDTTSRNSPTKVNLPYSGKAVSLAAGTGHNCVVTKTGRVACWGAGFSGQLGNRKTDVIGDDELLIAETAGVAMPDSEIAIMVTAGNRHSCALLATGKVTCWGSASDGRLGNGMTTGDVLEPPAPVSLPAPGIAKTVAAGGSHTCVVLQTNRISCWGYNANGEIGLGTTNDQLTPSAPLSLPNNEPAMAVSTGYGHTCALLAGDDVTCWGLNFDGRSGYETPNYIGDNETPAQQGIVTLDYALTKFNPLAPRRILDTRPGASINYSGAKPGIDGVVSVPIPTDLSPRGSAFIGAVVLNVTITDATAPGYVTAYSASSALPNASNLNVSYPGQTIANLVTVQTGADGQVNLFTSNGGHLIVDLVGYYDQAATSRDGRLATAPAPTRILDTRPGALINYAGAKPAADSTLVMQVSGRNGLPATGIRAVVLNVTAAEATAPGFITVWPEGSRPNASNLNLDRPGQTLPNQVIVPLGPDGAVRLYSERGAHLIVDVTGWFTDSSASNGFTGLFVPVSPYRHLETRPSNRLTAGGTVDVQIGDVGHVPTSLFLLAVSANVTAVDATATGYVTAYPPAATPPNASNLNVEAGQTVPNHVTVGLDKGRIRLFTERGTHLLVDVNGYYVKEVF
jgi:hypothetical protein